MTGPAPTISQLFPVAASDRLTIVGASGSGKSWAARRLLEEQVRVHGRRVFILDSKGSKSLESDCWQIVRSKAELDDYYLNPRNKRRSVLFRTDPFLSPDDLEKLADDLFRWAYLNGERIVYVDELMEVCKSASQYPPALRALATRGREKGVALWGATQRPKGIPLVLLSEANHYFVFSLRLEDDRKRMNEAAEYNVAPLIASLKPRQFLYIRPDASQVTGPYTLV